ncbi:PAS domain-containing sensor histidine kinase [Siccirubricoccus sp. G192]|uniref:PAS domain-containing sensor histidine kinase n=1 Tax=Siccirubricoccus sp. G192 TaxID=2849651 RepID=UPI001C2B96BB|nr:PAS domain S-box protein [Siccirubricoccus sp. G192]MBV1795906.1 PAS domain S-box protein [Siccirubricoccus sp. G192]
MPQAGETAKPARMEAPGFLAGGGDMGARMRGHDWSSSPLGPPEGWPRSLRTVVGLMLGSRHPMFLAWGPDLAFLYNDGYAPILGTRHPWAVGRPFQEVWPEIWEDILPLIDRALAGEATWSEDLHLVMERNAYPEDTWYTFSYSPLRDEEGAIAGMFCACTETTAKVLAERRLGFRLMLEDRLRGLEDPRAVTATAAEALGRHLGAAQVGYAEVDAEGIARTDAAFNSGRLPDFPGGRYRLDEFGQGLAAALGAGQAVVVEEVAQDARTASPQVLAAHARISLRAYIIIPLVRGGRLTAYFYAAEPEPRRWTAEEVALAQEVAERTWAAVERARADAALQESEARFRNMADHAPVMMWVSDLRGACLYLNRRWYEFTGQAEAEALGLGWTAAVHPEDRDRAREAFLEATRAQQAFRLEYRLRRADGEYGWAIDAAAPRFGEGGEFLGFVGSVIDITERKRLELRQRLLIGELNHRVKNTLATVQAMAAQTLRPAEAPERAVPSFTARLRTLARAHDVLTREGWHGAWLADVVAEATAAHQEAGGERFRITGPPVRIGPRMVLSLAMALHELATNATKYGALSAEGGWVGIAWHVEGGARDAGSRAGEPMLRLRWREHGGPPVVPPVRRGFGSRLLGRALAAELAGKVRLDFAEAGVACDIDAPLRQDA